MGFIHCKRKLNRESVCVERKLFDGKMVKIGILGQIIGGMGVKYWEDVWAITGGMGVKYWGMYPPHPPGVCSPQSL